MPVLDPKRGQPVGQPCRVHPNRGRPRGGPFGLGLTPHTVAVNPSTVLSGVVLPELDAVFRPGEVRSIEVTVVVHGGHEWGPPQDALELTVSAGPEGETFGSAVWQSVVMAGWSTAQMRERLRDDLVDFVAASSFGWGEQRT